MSLEYKFPINSRHQEVATQWANLGAATAKKFPINSRHQEVATARMRVSTASGDIAFPINSRHQEVATIFGPHPTPIHIERRFQSIAATKKWRLLLPSCCRMRLNWRFQSIAATKKWRLPERC